MSRRKLKMMTVAVRKGGRTYAVNVPKREVRDFRARLKAQGECVSMRESAKRLVRGALERGIFKLPKMTGPT